MKNNIVLDANTDFNNPFKKTWVLEIVQEVKVCISLNIEMPEIVWDEKVKEYLGLAEGVGVFDLVMPKEWTKEEFNLPEEISFVARLKIVPNLTEEQRTSNILTHFITNLLQSPATEEDINSGDIVCILINAETARKLELDFKVASDSYTGYVVRSNTRSDIHVQVIPELVKDIVMICKEESTLIPISNKETSDI